MEHKIKIYPVGNADCILVKLSNGKTIIFDCQIHADLCENGKQIWFDVKTDLLKELPKDSLNRPYVDLYVNTHPHDDHCKGFEENFYHGDPDMYDKDKDKDKILIGELWVTTMLFKNDIAKSAEEIRREAKRRRSLYDNDNNFTGSKWNYLRIIGYDKDNEYDTRYGYIPGKVVDRANGTAFDWLSIFIHAPFKKDIETAKRDDDKNATSIVVQLRFSVEGKENVCRALFAGDAEHEIWQHILENNADDENLRWNIFVAPHHCSWTFFNESNNKNEVLPSAENILALQIGNKSEVVASSKEILNDKDNPPCFEARQEYKNRLMDSQNFFNTATFDVNSLDIPQPITYIIGSTGKRKELESTKAAESVVSRPAPRAGLK